MDSLTQAALGAAIGQTLLGRKIGKRAALIGAVVATFPDLDILVPHIDPIAFYVTHRSWSHSFLGIALLTPLFAFLLQRWRWANDFKDTVNFREWMLAVFLMLITHALLDAFTVFGTQLFWPYPSSPEMWSSLFIIDPLYTLPLLIGVLTGLFTRVPKRMVSAPLYGLIISTAYIGWSLSAKMYVEIQTRTALAQHGMSYDKILTVPTAFNTLLWRIVVLDKDVYHEGYYSLFEGGLPKQWRTHSHQKAWLYPLAESHNVQRLAWFSHGFYKVSREQDAIIMSDLRMGSEKNYIFRFKVAEIKDGILVETPPKRLKQQRVFTPFTQIWCRISDARVSLF